ncbi:MAG: AAA family ATPase [Bacteroidota bacterium]
MKILALRVRNLTSLAGEAVLDFEAPPLASAGLFAITGPTGAGKSTLLDALCLALYDRLPRLGHGDDVRSALRHGAADAFAEVDFAGRDGGRYRARWEVRRARNRADGRIQAQTMALTDLATGAALGGGKRETLDAIADKVGLDYHQFRRSVLLAQNDFDAFLRAKPDDRANLLELMTGTAIYGELSMAAYDRAKSEEAALKALDDELKRVNVLADDERAVVATQSHAADEHAARLGDEVEGLAREIEWYRLAADLAARVAEAEEQMAAAAERLAQAQPERERMIAVRRALGLAPLLHDADRLSTERERLTAESDRAATALAEGETALVRAVELRDHARAADEAAETAFKAAGPLLDRAADLDTRLGEGRQRLARCAEAVQTSQALVRQAQQNADDLAGERQRCTAAIAASEQWLADHDDRRALAEQLDRWLDLIAAHAKAAQDRDHAAERFSQARRQQADLTRQGEADAALAETLAERQATIERAVEALNTQADAVDSDALDHRREGLAALDDALATLLDCAAAAQALDRRAADLAERRQTAEARQAQATQDATALGERLTTLRAALSEAQAALALAEAAEGEQALVLRQRLLDGQPCPVCGSLDHPIAAGHGALTALLGVQRRRVAELEGERDDVLRCQAEAAAIKHAAGDTLAQVAADTDRLATERRQLVERHRDATTATATLAGLWQITLPADGDAARAHIAAERQALGDSLRAARAAETERRRLLQEREQLRRQALAVAERQAVAANSRAELATEERAARGDGERAAAAMADCAERLASPLALLPDWRERLKDAAGLTADLTAMAEEWRRIAAQLDNQRTEAQTLNGKTDSAAAALDNARRNAERDSRLRDDEQAALDRLSAARAPLFDGEATSAVRTRLNDQRKARRDDHQRAQDAWAAAAQAQSAAHNRVAMLAEARTAADRAAEAAAQSLAAGLTSAALDVEDVRAAMALGNDWMDAAEAHQARLREDEAAAQAVLSERRQSAAAHAAAGQPERSADELAAALADRTAERDLARDLSVQLRQRLAEDDRNRGAAEDTRRLIASQRRRFDLWKGMADLIGSADGKKFRLFAQGLTLDRLLGLANVHLAELTPRYVLQRAPGADLDLQVIDRDMADDVRAVANLSGGERFLVSLALALGLASMTGSRTIAESLFIDEGFGALDAESLDVAIGALETLHAAGRKVGVISHVQAMIDRIGVQIRITRLGGGRSAVEIRGG